MQKLSVDADVVLLRIGLGSQFRDRTAIDGDPSGRDQFLSFPPRCNSGGGNDLL